MKLSEYLSTREGAMKENRISRMSILVLAVLCLVLAFSLHGKSTAVVMVPPNLEHKAEVDARRADKEMQVAWGIFISGLLGNVTPQSSASLKKMVAPHLSSRLYNQIVEGIDQQIKSISEEQLTLSFAPRSARYDDEIGKVIVTGELVIRGLRGQEKRELRMYQMGFTTRNYRVLLDSMRVCQDRCSNVKSDEE